MALHWEFLHSLAQSQSDLKKVRNCTSKFSDAYQEFIILKGNLK